MVKEILMFRTPIGVVQRSAPAPRINSASALFPPVLIRTAHSTYALSGLFNPLLRPEACFILRSFSHQSFSQNSAKNNTSHHYP